MALYAIDPNKEASFAVSLGSTFDSAPRQSLHGLKYNFKPAAIDYSQPGTLKHAEDENAGEVSLVVASTADGEHHVFKGPLQETKSNEFVLIYDPETNSFVLDRLSSISRLAATRESRATTFNGAPSYVHSPADQTRNRSRSNEDVPRISLDSAKETTVDEVDEEVPLPTLVTPRLPPSSPQSTRSTRVHEIVSSDDDSDIDIGGPAVKVPQQDDDVSDEDLDDLANELESSLENRPGSSSEDVDDSDGPPRGGAKPPDFGNVPRSGGPISMSSRFAGARRRAEEEESSSSEDDD